MGGVLHLRRREQQRVLVANVANVANVMLAVLEALVVRGAMVLDPLVQWLKRPKLQSRRINETRNEVLKYHVDCKANYRLDTNWRYWNVQRYKTNRRHVNTATFVDHQIFEYFVGKWKKLKTKKKVSWTNGGTQFCKIIFVWVWFLPDWTGQFCSQTNQCISL